MNTVDTLWVLLSAALVLFMTPGLALFYGGMVRSKNVLSVMMNSFIAMGVITVLWVVIGGSLAFGSDVGGGLLGDLSLAGFANLAHHLPGFSAGGASPMAVMTYQMMFAIITAALISGGTTDRIKFSAFIILISLWMLLVYVPLAHWVFSPEGWLASRGVLDFAGGTVVEINSGFSTLAIVLVLGKRRGWPGEAMAPHSVPLSLLGVGILWFGWFGFNAGSALMAGQLSSAVFLNTQVSTAAGALAWILVERMRDGKATTLGVASGAIAGAVAITPACGYVNNMGALFVGLAAGAICSWAVGLKYRLGFDDSLDVVGVHGVGGLVGMIGIGLLATTTVNGAGANGLFSGGGFGLLGKQAIASAATLVYAFVITALLALIVDKTIGLRVHANHERAGLDISLHAESAYDYSGASAGTFAGIAGHSSQSPFPPQSP